MDCPKYTNAFTVTYNSILGEMVINFVHDYPVIEGAVQRDPSTGEIETTSGRENVCGVVLPAEIAYQLQDVIKKALPKRDANDE